MRPVHALCVRWFPRGAAVGSALGCQTNIGPVHTVSKHRCAGMEQPSLERGELQLALWRGRG